MSTFAVFGMTADVALAEARKTAKTTKPSGKVGCPPLDLTLAEWNEEVQKQAEKIMQGKKVRQLSPAFDAPQYAEQFVTLARKVGCPPLDLTLAEWNEEVQKQAEKIMQGKKVRQLSPAFDAPQYAEQFVTLARKAGNCRDLRVRAKCEITDAEGRPVINKKTKAPRIGWVDYQPEMTPKVA